MWGGNRCLNASRCAASHRLTHFLCLPPAVGLVCFLARELPDEVVLYQVQRRLLNKVRGAGRGHLAIPGRGGSLLRMGSCPHPQFP